MTILSTFAQLYFFLLCVWIEEEQSMVFPVEVFRLTAWYSDLFSFTLNLNSKPVFIGVFTTSYCRPLGNTPWLICLSEVWPPHYDQLIFQKVNLFLRLEYVTFWKAIYIAIHFLFSACLWLKKCTDDFIMRAYYVEMKI